MPEIPFESAPVPDPISSMEDDRVVEDVQGNAGGLTDLADSISGRPVGNGVESGVGKLFSVATLAS